MAELRFQRSAPSVFGGLIWLLIGMVLFALLYLGSMPRGEALRALRTAGPDGVTAFFPSPEAAVIRINRMLDAHEWTKLARYYDFSQSVVTRRPGDVRRLFRRRPSRSRPRDRGRGRFRPGGIISTRSRPAAEGVVRIVVAAPGVVDPAPEETQSFVMERSAEGYRIVPPDAATHAAGPPSAP